MGDNKDYAIEQYKWLKIGQSVVLIVLGAMFFVNAWLSEDGIGDALSYCMGTVLAVYGTLNAVAGYLLFRTPTNTSVMTGLISVALAVVLFYKAEYISGILSVFLASFFLGLSVMIVVSAIDKIIKGKKALKEAEKEKEKEEYQDFDLIKRKTKEGKKKRTEGILYLALAAFIIVACIVYLYFYMQGNDRIERYMIMIIGFVVLIFGISSLFATVRKIKETEEIITEAENKKNLSTNNTTEIQNYDVKIIDISELKTKKTRRKRTASTKTNNAEDKNEIQQTNFRIEQ